MAVYLNATREQIERVHIMLWMNPDYEPTTIGDGYIEYRRGDTLEAITLIGTRLQIDHRLGVDSAVKKILDIVNPHEFMADETGETRQPISRLNKYFAH